MDRYEQVEAIILENRRIGEKHKGVALYTQHEGVIRAIAYGGYSHKGSLRGVTAPFVHGTAWLYREPGRDSSGASSPRSRIKLSDFDPVRMNHELREDLLRFYTAGLWAELVMRSYGGGEATFDTFSLLRQALALLCEAEGSGVRRLSVQVQLRYLELAGAPVDPDHVRGEIARQVVVSSYELPLERAASLPLDSKELSRIQRALYRRIERLIEGPLRTVHSSGGVL